MKQKIEMMSKIHISKVSKLHILEKMIKLYNNQKIEKNQKITIEKLDITCEFEKVQFMELQSSIEQFYNNQQSLNSLYKKSTIEIKILLKSYKMPQKLYYAFRQILLDLITFNTVSNMKMPFNSQIEMVHRDVSKKKLLKEYNFTFEL